MKRAALFFLLLLLMLVSNAVFVKAAEVDEVALVASVIDGDTFRTSSGQSIRLADIDTPEYGETGYSQAKDYLENLIDGKTVYLDIDDVYRHDDEGRGSRLVCVVYVSHNTTHSLNVNKALLVAGHAVVWEHNNEFNPYSWTLFESINQKPEDFGLGVIVLLCSLAAIIVAVIVAIYFRKQSRRLDYRDVVVRSFFR